ncbi:MAG: formyltransferase family protein [Candidatus Hydrogenedentota bacterium]|mgnify:CR=1 FL=1
MLRVALFALPGPGDAVMEIVAPVLLVRGEPSDFPDALFPTVDANAPDFLSRFRSAGPDLVLVAGWESRIPSSLYADLPFGGWNIHPSLLPNYRGHNPYFHVIAKGETETGVTVHRLTDQLDAGDILLQRRFTISSGMTIGDLWRELGKLGAKAAEETLVLLNGHASIRDMLRPQPTGTFPRAPHVQPADLLLTPDMTLFRAGNLIRACHPFYGAISRIDDRIVKVYEARPCGNKRISAAGPLLHFSDGSLEITSLDVEGEGLMTGEEFLRRFRGASAPVEVPSGT